MTPTSDQPKGLDAPHIEAAHTGIWSKVSWVWLVPVAALIVAMLIIAKTYTDRGPEVTIVFDNASGIVAGQTAVRYRDVVIGAVEEVGFSDDISQVEVQLRIERDIAPFVTKETQFWIVRPQVTAQGITGLGTVLSGAYIGVALPEERGPLAQDFIGLEQAPLNELGEEGMRITLRSAVGASLTTGAPVLYKGIEVGSIEETALASDGAAVIVTAFIRAPYDDLVTYGTRFWNASGFSVNVGLTGASLNVGSLLSLVRGGITFDTVFASTEPLGIDNTFRLYTDEATARASLFDTATKRPVTLAALFGGSISGLRTGANVRYRGVTVGTVSSLSTRINDADDGSREVQLLAAFELDPGRFGLRSDAPNNEFLDLLAELVEARGLRAQVSSGSIFTGVQQIDLTEISDIEVITLDRENQPFPLIPSISTAPGGLAETAEGLLTRLDELPIEQVMNAATRAMDSVTLLLNDPAIRDIPAEAGGLLQDIRGLIQSDGVQNAPIELAASLTALRQILESAEEAALTEALSVALVDVQSAATAIEQATTDLTPQIGSSVLAITKVMDAVQLLANDPSTRAIPTEVAQLTRDVRQILADPALQEIPQGLSTSLANLNTVLTQINESALPTQLQSTLITAEQAAGELRDLMVSAQDLPGEISNVLNSANALFDAANTLANDPSLQAAPAEVTGALQDLRAILQDPATRAIPSEMNAALAALNRVLNELETAGLAEKVALTLTDASRAAAAIATASEDVPGLIERLDTLAQTANSLPVEQLAAEATTLITDLRAIVSADGADELPRALTSTLDELTITLTQLRGDGVYEGLAETLVAAQSALMSIDEAAQDVPALLTRLGRVADQADTTLRAFGENSQISRETIEAIRDIRDTARAVSALVRQIERNPNSLILGR